VTDRKTVDWEAIEREYRAGQLSLREIGRRFDVTDTAVRSELSREPVDDEEIVRTHAQRGARAIEGHLSRAGRLKGIFDTMVTQLEVYLAGGTPAVPIFVSKGDSPATIMRTCAGTLESIEKVERRALNIDEPSDSPGEALARIERRIIDANNPDT